MNGLRRVCYVVVLSIFLLALAAVRSDSSRKILGTLLGDGVHWDPPDLDPDKVWFDWRKAIEDVTYDIQDLHSTSYSKGNINSDAQCTEMNEEKATQLKKLFPNCLGSKKLSLCISWKCLLWLSSPSRRHLISKLNQRKEGSSPYPLLKPQSKAEVSSPSKDSKNRKVKSPPSKAKNGSNSSGDSLKDFIIFVVAASVAIISILAMLLCCCLRGGNSKVGPRGSVKDDKPLLFCTSNISGSSQSSHGLEQLSNKEFKSSSVLNGPLNHNVSSLSQPCLSTVSTGSACEATPILLPLPPGRTAPPAFVQPPPFAASSTPPSPPPPSPPPPPPPPPSPPPPQMRPKAPAAPPPPPPKAPGPRAPPPPPNAVHPPPAPLAKPPSHHRGSSSLGSADELSEDSHKAKLKPFFWDKVSANPDQAMVWHELKAGSFQVNEEMMESLFGYTPASKNRKDREGSSSFDGLPKIQIIDAKKSQNLSILLRALNVTTEEVCDALREGSMLPPELVHTLIKMAPTSEEELKLRLFNGDLSQLGVAERFLKFLVEIPFAFKRLECLLFMSSLQEEVSGVKEAFKTLEVASTELRNSRLFLKLLEAVLKTGNRMNDGTYRGGAQAFKLDTLLKLSDVKGLDGKTTLLHFVIQEIIRSEGVRAARTLRQSQSISSVKTEDLSAESPNESAEYYRSLGLQVVSGLSGTLENVKKAAHIDGDNLSSTCARLGSSLFKIKVFLNNDMKTVEEESEFRNALEGFVEQKEGEIGWVIEEEKRIMALVKKTADYFHGDAGKDEGLRLFVIVRDFLIILDKSCNDVKKLASSVPMKPTKKEASSAPACSESPQKEMSDIRQRLFPAIKDRRMSDSSSDDSSSDDDS